MCGQMHRPTPFNICAVVAAMLGVLGVVFWAATRVETKPTPRDAVTSDM